MKVVVVCGVVLCRLCMWCVCMYVCVCVCVCVCERVIGTKQTLHPIATVSDVDAVTTTPSSVSLVSKGKTPSTCMLP